jgi:hypothetical protein
VAKDAEARRSGSLAESGGNGCGPSKGMTLGEALQAFGFKAAAVLRTAVAQGRPRERLKRHRNLDTATVAKSPDD